MTLPTVSSAPDIIADVPAPNPPLIAPNIAPDSKPLANPSKTTFLLSLMLLLNFYYKAMRSASLINFLVLISVVIIWIHYQFIFLHIFSFFIIPFLAVHFNYYTCIAPAGATSEDTTLPVMLKYTNEETVVLSVLNGVICSFCVPILISFCLNIK